MQPRSHPDLLKGSINQNIIRMSLPMIVAMLFQTGFSVIDMVFVGMVGPEALAAVSIVFPVMFFSFLLLWALAPAFLLLWPGRSVPEKSKKQAVLQPTALFSGLFFRFCSW